MGNDETLNRWKKEDPDIDKYKVCPKCNGTTQVLKSGEFIDCPKCKGTGTVRK